MAGLYPETQARKASEFFAELEAVSSVVLPEWNGVQREGEFGYALLKVLATLVERSSTGIAKTPQRDTIAFFNYLDVPPQPPRPATAPLAFQLNDKQVEPVFAPAAAQVGAATDDQEQIFETTVALQLSPARLDFLAAVDTVEDSVEIAPQNFLAFEREDTQATQFRVPTVTNAGSESLQLEPPEGLAKGDYVQFTGDPEHTAVYRLGEGSEGLFQLLDPLEQQVAANSALRKVTEFAAFALRNVQSHEFFLGHKELLNLEQSSQLTVIFEPAEVADSLSGKLEWALYGTRVNQQDGTEETGWHVLKAASAVSGSIVLTKTWPGSVDEFEVHGKKNRWLRARHKDPIAGRELTAPTRTVKIKVKSLDSSEAGNADKVLEGCCRSAQNAAESTDAGDTDTPVADKSISQAFYNNSPLPLTTRFFPFGPEPQRFDTFSIAAPEALSKKGAIAYLDVTLSDASISAISVAETVAGEGPRRAYAIGHNGQLQLVSFESNAPVWEDLGAPSPDDLRSDSESVTADRLNLDTTRAPAAIQYQYAGSTAYDALVARDMRGQLWLNRPRWTGTNSLTFEAGNWVEIKSPDATVTDYLLAYRKTVGGSPRVSVIAIANNKLQHVRILGGVFRGLRSEWEDVQFDNAQPFPELNGDSLVLPVQESGWPEPMSADPSRLMVTDKDGGLWLGEVTFNLAVIPNPEVTVQWTALALADNAEEIDPDIRPAACRNQAGDIFVYAASRDINQVLRPRVIDRTGGVWNATDHPGPALNAGAVFQADPTGFGDEVRAVTTGSLNGDPSVFIFRESGLNEDITLPAGVADPAPAVIFPLQDVPLLVIGGNTENLLVQQLPDPVDVQNYLDALVLTTAQAANQWMEFTGAAAVPPEVVAVPDVANARISPSGQRIFEFPAGEFAIGQWDLWKFDSAAQLIRDAANQDADELKVTGAVQPVKDDIIIIKQKRFVVQTDPDANDLITLDNDISSLPNGLVVIDIVSAAGSFNVDASHEKTLLEIVEANTAIGDPLRLKFSPEGVVNPAPEQQDIASFEVDGQTLWVLIGAAWGQAPDPAVTVELFVAETNVLASHAYPRNFQNPELAWEYFDGDGWRRLENAFVDRTENFARSGIIEFPVPADLSLVEVAGQEDYFIRARLVGGDYGRPVYKVQTTPGSGGASTQSVTVDTSGMQPPEIQRVTATYELVKERDPEMVLVSNNLTVRNQTQAAFSEGAVFDLLEGAQTLDNEAEDPSQRAIYLGFTRPIGNSSLSLFVDAFDVEGEQKAIFEVLGNNGWRRISADDRTRGFRQRGFVQISVDTPAAQTRLFGQDRYWLRARLTGGATAWQPQLRSVYMNAVAAIQAKTVRQELLGSSIGEPEQAFQLSNQPVLPDSLELRVRESLTREERDELIEIFGANAIARFSEIDLEGDWVLWRRVDSFVGLGAVDRVYRLDALSGTVEFGLTTRVPPAGRDNLRAVSYRSGGGSEGNVAAYSIKALKSSIRGVEKTLNPVAASGGTDTPAVAEQLGGSPALIRRAGRALMPADIEALVVASSPDIVRARCLFAGSPGDPVRIAVARRGAARCPRLSLAERKGLNDAVRREAWGGLAPDDVVIEDPAYVGIKVDVELRAKKSELAAALREAAIVRLRRLFDPIDGGPGNRGWPFARPVWRSDVLRALSELESLDHTVRVDIRRSDCVSLSSPLPPTGMICAAHEDIGVSVVLDPGECGGGD